MDEKRIEEILRILGQDLDIRGEEEWDWLEKKIAEETRLPEGSGRKRNLSDPYPSI